MTEDGRKVVLVVEDEPSVQRWINQHLTAHGYNVMVAAHVQAAVGLLEVRTPDVVCVDLVLPRESGYDLCEYMRKSARFRHIPLIVLSDRTSPLERAHAEEAGASRFLLKPNELVNLASEVESLLASPPSSGSVAPPSGT